MSEGGDQAEQAPGDGTSGRGRGKNIVLCSDGTGNRGGKIRGTNVWRIYSAVDRACRLPSPGGPQQIAFYDEGVGSDDFKLVKLLGGAVGWGLKRNIRELYTYLVKNYERDDRIYLFGFSRGAFTVRALAGLVCRVGLVDRHQCADDVELRRQVRAAVNAYRWYYRNPGKSLDPRVAALKLLRNDDPERSVRKIPIRFIGVWDTVDAVGLPFDELNWLLELVYPYKFKTRQLDPSVRHGCHALSIDDARRTFHPVMWDEQGESGGRIEQVWFAGVHSNVGGGYRRDEMALVALNWMMAKASAHGLRFKEQTWQRFAADADVHGKLYDSRAYLAAYYRYQPRDVAALCARHGVRAVGAHASVFARIARFTRDYVPANLECAPGDAGGPLPLVVVGDGQPDEQAGGLASLQERLDAGAGRRRARMAATRPIVRKLTWLYYAFLALSLATIALALSPGTTSDALSTAGAPPGSAVVGMEEAALRFLAPGFLADLLHPLIVRGDILIVVGAGLSLLFGVRCRLRGRVRDLAYAAWRTVFPIDAAAAAEEGDAAGSSVPPPRRTARRLACWLAGGALTAYLLAAMAGFFVQSWFPPACKTGSAVLTEVGTTPVTIRDFDPADPCYATGLALQAGERYRFIVTEHEGWRDKNITAGPDGFFHPALALAAPLRRFGYERWFTLMGEIGGGGGQTFRIGSAAELRTVRKSGELFLFVNDAVCWWGCRDRWRFYANNAGSMTLTVRRLID